MGQCPERDLLGLIQVIRSNHPESVIQQCRTLLNRGREPLVVLQNLASFYLNLLVAKTAPQRGDLIAVTQPTWAALCEEAKGWDTALILKGQQHLKESEYQLKNTTQPRLWLEITLLGLLPSALANIQAIATETVTIPAPVIPHAPKTAAQPQVTPPAPPVVEHPFGEVPKSSPAPASTPAPIPQPQAIAPPVVSPPTPTVAPPVPPPVEPPPEIRRSPDPMPEPLPMETPVAPPAAETNGNGHHPPEKIPSETIAPVPEPVPEPPAPQPTPELNTGEISAPSSSPTISALEREQLWETMLAQLQPPTTQQLLRQQGCLVTFTGNMALVGIKSRPLLNMAKNKQKNIEEAFQKACQQTVRVSFQIGHESASEMDDAPIAMASSTPAPPSVNPPTPAIAPPSQPQSVPNPFDGVPSPAPQSPPVAPVPNPQPIASVPTPTPQPVANRPPISAVPTQPVAQPPAETTQEPSLNSGEELASTPENGVNAAGDRLNNMANEFADVFAGEVIDLPHLAPDDAAENSAGIALDTPTVIPPQTVAQAPQPEPAMGVQGRPPVTTSPEDEIPF